MRAFARHAEDGLATLAFAGIMLLPLAEIVLRNVAGVELLGAGPIAQNLTIWVGLLGAAIAAREGKLLTLATGEFLPKGRVTAVAHVVAAIAGSAIATMFAVGGAALITIERAAGDEIAGGIPVWIAVTVFPIAFGLIAARLVWRSSDKTLGRAIAATGIIIGYYLAQHWEFFEGRTLWPWLVIVLGCGLFGAPIFALLGGAAMFAFFTDGGRPVVPLIKAYELLTSPTANLAAIPLFTLAGLMFAEGKSSERLLRALRAFFGWFPGGTAVAAATLCAFFTLFTGGSGVTILAIGGLLLPALLKDGYRERFSMGLLTAAGSLGLLFPLSVPLILYGIVAQTQAQAGQSAAIEDLFVGGLLPGTLMLGLVGLLGVREALAVGAKTTPFRLKEMSGAMWEAKWEMLLPVVVLVFLLGGYATMSQTAAIAALYAVIVQRFIHRDLPSTRDLVRVSTDCLSLAGGVLIILAVAVGLTNYMVNAQVPSQLIDWTKSHVESRLAFLLALNVFLLIVGTMMDIFSAIVVVVPLIVPLAMAYDINLVHLGIIFVANLELGYLHPPLGLNLLLASYRFGKSVWEVTLATLPMLLVLAIGVLMITYIEWLTMGLVNLLGSAAPPG